MLKRIFIVLFLTSIFYIKVKPENNNISHLNHTFDSVYYYIKIQSYLQSLKYLYNIENKVFSSSDSFNISNYYTCLGMIYFELENYESMQKNIEKGMQIAERNKYNALLIQ